MKGDGGCDWWCTIVCVHWRVVECWLDTKGMLKDLGIYTSTEVTGQANGMGMA